MEISKSTLNKLIDIALIVGIIIFAIKYFNKPDHITEIEYIYGIPDTVEIKLPIETVFDTVYVEKADSISNDSSGYYAKTDFDIGTDSVGVSGLVEYLEPNFIFSKVKIRNIEKIKTITRVDTILKQTMIEKPFYEIEWFWAFTLSLVLFFSTLYLNSI